MLYDPSRHEALTETPWSAARAGATVEQIVGDATVQVTPGRFWPVHPREAADYHHCVYLGAAGVIWALHYLAERGFGEHHPEIYGLAPGLLTLNREDHSRRKWLLDLCAQGLSVGPHGLLCGDAGILALQGRLYSIDAIAEPLGISVDKNADDLLPENWTAVSWKIPVLTAGGQGER